MKKKILTAVIASANVWIRNLKEKFEIEIEFNPEEWNNFSLLKLLDIAMNLKWIRLSEVLASTRLIDLERKLESLFGIKVNVYVKSDPLNKEILISNLRKKI